MDQTENLLIFDEATLRQAVATALAEPSFVPEGKRGVMVVRGHREGATPGVQAILAVKIGDVWTVGGELVWHGGPVQAGLSVMASW